MLEKIFVTKDTQNKKVYRVYGTYDGQNPWFYEIDKDFETLKSNEKIDIDKEREAFVPKDEKTNAIFNNSEETVDGSEQSEQIINMADGVFEQQIPDASVIPAYYKGPTGTGRLVYTFVGRDGISYYRVYGTVDGANKGFYSSNEFGNTVTVESVIDVSIENMTIAPYNFVVKPVEGTTPSEANGFAKDAAQSSKAGFDVYKYETNSYASAYRSFGEVTNVIDPSATKGWHRITAEGKYDTRFGAPKFPSLRALKKSS
ncbi:hypothetical protein MGH68_01915 [Erysipelothrix sp. D19-032]